MNAVVQPARSRTLEKLGDLAVAQGNLPEVQRLFGESRASPSGWPSPTRANAAWQRDLSVSC
jgi:hypothetical protein